MNQVSRIVQYDSHLHCYTVDFIEDGENETAVFETPDQASDFVKELVAQGHQEFYYYD